MKNLILHRKDFLKKLLIGTASGIVLLPQLIKGQKIDKGPQLDPALVKEFVSKGHGDLQGTKKLYEENPALLHASWDWGGGDFESALEGASHVGSKDCAKFLIEKGARMNIFTAAMLGKMDIVKAILTAFPEQLHAKGAHKLSLMHHAKKGGDEALAVVEYLKSLGVKE